MTLLHIDAYDRSVHRTVILSVSKGSVLYLMEADKEAINPKNDVFRVEYME